MYQHIGRGIMAVGLFGVLYSITVSPSVGLMFGGFGIGVVGAIISGIVR